MNATTKVDRLPAEGLSIVGGNKWTKPEEEKMEKVDPIIQIIELPLSRVDDIARALKTGWNYVSRTGKVVTLSKTEEQK